MESTDVFNESLNSGIVANQKLQPEVSSTSGNTVYEKSVEGGNDELSKPSTIITNKLKLALVALGLVLSIFIAALDETIVATALGAISKEFAASGEITWIAGAYLLTTTAFQPLYGKFSDIFGRKLAIGFALVVFLVGSIGCGVANDVITLIFFRGLSGVGAGGLISLSFIIISDSVQVKSRSAYMSLINVTFAFANVIAPLIGGVFVDYLNWRWVFYINIPIVLVTMAVVLGIVPLAKGEGNIKAKLARVDGLGTITLILAVVAIVLALNWGGKDYQWNSAPVLVSLIVGIILLGIFIWIELRYAVEPVIPARVFTPNVIFCNITTCFAGALLFIFLNYWPLYHQTVHGSTATQAGIEVIPFLVGLCGFAAISGVLCSKTGKYRYLMRLGMLLSLLGMSLMSRLAPDWYRAEEIIYPLIIGIGVGLNIQICVICCQAAVAKEDAAIVTSLSSFSISVGGVLGLAIQGAVFNNVLINELSTNLPNHNVMELTKSLASLSGLTQFERYTVLAAYTTAYRWLFTSMIPYTALGFISTIFLKHIPF